MINVIKGKINYFNIRCKNALEIYAEKLNRIRTPQVIYGGKCIMSSRSLSKGDFITIRFIDADINVRYI